MRWARRLSTRSILASVSISLVAAAARSVSPTVHSSISSITTRSVGNDPRKASQSVTVLPTGTSVAARESPAETRFTCHDREYSRDCKRSTEALLHRSVPKDLRHDPGAQVLKFAADALAQLMRSGRTNVQMARQGTKLGEWLEWKASHTRATSTVHRVIDGLPWEECVFDPGGHSCVFS
uniref:Hypothetical secreted protein 696 n=1 Tax=Amblyomma variegatum TaxID=34610 RepID=F0JA73_AMBVA|nr:TPA_inf: hypothetical secreted protein 696 [Amblyomma variegatum]